MLKIHNNQRFFGVAMKKKALLQADLPDYILEIRRKLDDSSYVDGAIHRIAQVLSRQIVENRFKEKV